MGAEVFSYLEKRLQSEFEGSGWNDDMSSRFRQKELAEMTEALHELIGVSQEADQLVKEVHSKILFY